MSPLLSVTLPICSLSAFTRTINAIAPGGLEVIAANRANLHAGFAFFALLHFVPGTIIRTIQGVRHASIEHIAAGPASLPVSCADLVASVTVPDFSPPLVRAFPRNTVMKICTPFQLLAAVFTINDHRLPFPGILYHQSSP